MHAFATRFAFVTTACLFVLSLGVPSAFAQASDPQGLSITSFASSRDVKSQITSMLASMKPDQGFMWQPLVRDGKTVAAIEIWKKPGRPAIHPADAEYAIVLEGSGTLVSGGIMADPNSKREDLIEGSRIENGQTQALAPGDVMLIPAGAPHWFGIKGDRLILLGIKLRSAK